MQVACISETEPDMYVLECENRLRTTPYDVP